VTPVPPNGCPRTEEAGSYLLGSLDPTERADYAAHLAHCPYCLREVGQLAGLPGLLARSPGPPRGVQPPPPPEARSAPPPPAGTPTQGSASTAASAASPDSTASAAASAGGEPTALVSALREIHRQRTRRRTLVAAALVLVALVGVGGTAAAAGVLRQPATGVVAAPQLPVPMVSTGNDGATAAVAINQKAWGTEVVMRCRYPGGNGYEPPVFSLVAKTTDGSNIELARWTAVPNRDIVLATATDRTPQQLTTLEIQDSAGNVVLRTNHI
jgi:anti-sigma factor RsiW